MPRKRWRALSSSYFDDDTESTFQETERAADGIGWFKFDEGGIPRRLTSTFIFKGVKGPTGYANRDIMPDNLISAFPLIINNHFIKHIKNCTEEDAPNFEERLDNILIENT